MQYFADALIGFPDLLVALVGFPIIRFSHHDEDSIFPVHCACGWLLFSFLCCCRQCLGIYSGVLYGSVLSTSGRLQSNS